MTKFPYDEFSKNYLRELLSSIGKVDSSGKLATEIKEIDVYYTLNQEEPVDEQKKQTLGLLGRFATTPAIFEPYRNAVTADGVRVCANKLFDVFADIKRTTQNKTVKAIEAELPLLWVLSPTASPSLLKGFSATLKEGWMEGVYFCGEHWKTVIVAIHKLPPTQETLWLRVLGRGKFQQQAIAELQALPEDNPLRNTAMHLLSNLKAIIQVKQDKNKEDDRLIMQLSPIYERDLAEALLQKINQGINPELRTQYQTLRAKKEAETLTDAEYNTLIQLSNTIEQFGAQRLEALANLAQLRACSLSELMVSLGIQPVTYVE
ncbi:hypothetical protein DSM106972_087320 [Dulcicalothrix desertica PCC 7102]|uniref:Flagellar assembly protein H n=1 Tax=Dulcicalothrix desertica PCC 7102 TaxID=232991 RepID=A0A433URT0_9CYAN|nr:hypothetical protein [Dulcicalothrix desertica]RUS96545.1 hypothetical protein DSM106972_087320 [Dulcicalothrix desertica PCC 7102]TWH51387.1 hypothetical protein CAL7102_05797 [Dulcicalothrix desertica PCC 7102]